MVMYSFRMYGALHVYIFLAFVSIAYRMLNIAVEKEQGRRPQGPPSQLSEFVRP